MYKGTYTDCAEYMIEYVKPDYNGGYKNNWLKLVPKQGNAGAAIIAYVANISSPDNKITLAETAVLYLDEHPDNQRGVDVSMWSPNGFLKTSVSYDNPTAYNYFCRELENVLLYTRCLCETPVVLPLV